MIRRKPYSQILAQLLTFFALPLLAAGTRAAEVDPSDLEAYLHAPYYEVEFFVFERSDVMDFTSDEILTLNRPRALPRTFRLQSEPTGDLWPEVIDPLTRACLTFPTLTYELLPPVSDGGAGINPSEEALPVRVGDAHPVPEISPILAPDPQLQFLAAMAEFERKLEDGSERWQPAENFQLTRQAARIERRGLGRVLFHGRWLQAVPPRETPEPLLVVGGQTLSLAAPTPELMGTVGVTLGRYLHFKADLYFHGPGLGLIPVSAVLDPTGKPIIKSELPVAHGYMMLSESRRMRSTELHYLDHPKLGLIVRIDPVSFPDELVERFAVLESLEEGAE